MKMKMKMKNLKPKDAAKIKPLMIVLRDQYGLKY